MRNKKNSRLAKPALISRLTTLPRRVVIVAIIAVVAGGSLAMPYVRADSFDDQINELRNQNASAQSNLNALLDQASSYQDAINQLQVQIDAVRGAIAANEAQQADLQAQITKQQLEIDKQKALLANTLKTMYVSGQLTSVEMLATSNDLSDYIDKQEAYSIVQDNIQKTMAQIQALQRSLQAKKAEIDNLLESQRLQNEQLSATQAKQNEMLAYNEGQQNAFNSQIASNTSRIGELRRLQAIENARYNIGPAGTGVNCGGGYPAKWCEIPQDSVIDSWGMYNRECVSYTAYKVHLDFLAGKTNRDMPYWGGIGNANQWDDNARNMGIPVDSNPTVGSIAVSNAGYYGHVMYVEHVYGDGTILVSQYNAGWDGKYSEARRYTTGLVFIHF